MAKTVSVSSQFRRYVGKAIAGVTDRRQRLAGSVQSKHMPDETFLLALLAFVGGTGGGRKNHCVRPRLDFAIAIGDDAIDDQK